MDPDAFLDDGPTLIQTALACAAVSPYGGYKILGTVAALCIFASAGPLAMVAVTALIGSRDLGQEIYKALPGADTGRGLLAGLGIAFIGIIADRLIGAWARKRKAELGLQ